MAKLPTAPHPSQSAALTPGLSWPPGFAGAIARYIYDSSPRPVPEVAIVSALGLLSGICGKAWVTPTSTGLNMYLILVARSAIGKEAMHTGISTLMHHVTKAGGEVKAGRHFVDFTDFASGQALQKATAANRSFVNITGEFGLRLKQIASSANKPDSPMQNLRRIIVNLYSKSSPFAVAGGIGYSDKDKNVDSIMGVAYSILGETTPSTFYELLTPDMMADGFMSRFMVVEYPGDRPDPNELADYFSEPCPELLAWLRQLVAYAVKLIDSEQVIKADYGLWDCFKLFKEFEEWCDTEVRKHEDESWRQMYNRAHLKALKLACLLAVADNSVMPTITTQQAEWAISFVKRDIATFSQRLTSGDVGMGDDARENKILSITQAYLCAEELPDSAKQYVPLQQANIIPRAHLQRYTQKVTAFSSHRMGSTKALTEALQSLVDAGHLMEVPKAKLVEEFGFHGKAYRILSLGGFRIQARTNWMDRVAAAVVSDGHSQH